MNIDQFLTHLDTFGADLDQWSDPLKRKEARAFLLQSLEARQAFESAQKLEALFISDAQNSHTLTMTMRRFIRQPISPPLG